MYASLLDGTRLRTNLTSAPLPAAPLPIHLVPRGYSGPVTFTYTVADSASPATRTADVTLNIPAPNVLIVPVNYTFQTPYETPIDSSKSSNLLADIQSSDPSKPMKLVVKGTIKSPPPSEGNVTVQPDGTYTFTPAANFSGEPAHAPAWPAGC